MGFCARVYRTRIEISPYVEGDIKKLERKWSVYIKQEYRYEPVAYTISGTRLIIPRGMDLLALSKLIGNTPVLIDDYTPYAKMRYRYRMKVLPRDKEQVQSINFLLSLDQFEKNRHRSQFALNLSTSFGKTYCAINAMVKMNMRTIIITHTKDIRKQWKSEILKFTTIYENQIREIRELSDLDARERVKFGFEYEEDIFIVTHSMITDFVNQYENGWERLTEFFEIAKIGLKIIDEAHLRFHNTLMIDFYTNTYKSFYLTATHGRSDEKEERLYLNAFANTVRFGESFQMRKHVNYRFVFFNSNPSQIEQKNIRTSRGVSSYLYADYAFGIDEYHTLELVLFKVLDKCLMIEGRTLILVPKIENTEYLLERIQERYPNISSGVINSKHTEKECKKVKEESRIIISTIKSLGTGSDIKKLRNLILSEPFSSKITANQVIGRLREYSSEEDTYVYELVNKGFKSIMKQVSRRITVIKKKCKTVTQSTI